MSFHSRMPREAQAVVWQPLHSICQIRALYRRKKTVESNQYPHPRTLAEKFQMAQCACSHSAFPLAPFSFGDPWRLSFSNPPSQLSNGFTWLFPFASDEFSDHTNTIWALPDCFATIKRTFFRQLWILKSLLSRGDCVRFLACLKLSASRHPMSLRRSRQSPFDAK